MALERIQKIIARHGLASRREAEEWIQLGQVTVNGKAVKLGDKADLSVDAIKVNGKLMQKTEPSRSYFIFHKPRQVISALKDPQGRLTIASYLEKLKESVYPVGRLDFNSDGLMILTNDGDLAEKVQKSSAIPRMYHVKVKGHPDEAMVGKLKRGGRMEGRVISPHSVRIAKNLDNKAIIEIVMIGSGVQDLKVFFENKGFLVEKMTRVAIGNLKLRDLKSGEYQRIEKSQVEALLDQPELLLKEIERATQKRIDSGRPAEPKWVTDKREGAAKDAAKSAAQNAIREASRGAVVGRGRPERPGVVKKSTGSKVGPKIGPKIAVKSGPRAGGSGRASVVRSPRRSSR